MRSKYRCSMCPAIHINSRSWLRSSSMHEPSDPPLRVVFEVFSFGFHQRQTSRPPLLLAEAMPESDGGLAIKGNCSWRKKPPDSQSQPSDGAQEQGPPKRRTKSTGERSGKKRVAGLGPTVELRMFEASPLAKRLPSPDCLHCRQLVDI